MTKTIDLLEGADAQACVARLRAALDATIDKALSGSVDYLRENAGA